MRSFIASLGLILASALSAAAQSYSVGGVRLDFGDEALRPRTQEQRAFVARYLAAVASGKADAVRVLSHPASLACSANDAGLKFIGDIHTRDAARAIPASARMIFLPFDVATYPFAATEWTTLPVQPTTVFALDYSTEHRDEKGVLTKSSGVTIMRLLAPHDGQLHLVEHCLTKSGEEVFAKKQAAAGQKSPAFKP